MATNHHHNGSSSNDDPYSASSPLTATAPKEPPPNFFGSSNNDELILQAACAQDTDDKATNDTTCIIIDNSRHVYLPLKLPCGVLVHCRPDVLTSCPRVLEDLEQDLSDCLNILPKSVHALIQRTRIWVNRSYCYTDNSNDNNERCVVLNHTTAHHHPQWLVEVARDCPDKTFSIELYNANGLDNLVIQKAFGRAKVSGLYDTIRRRDWAGREDDQDFDLAYAMVDCKEFFAELSVAYWSRGYRELDTQDKHRILLCSPPLMEPNVIARVQKRHPEYQGTASHTSGTRGPFEWFLARICPSFRRRRYHHCNKFYPFTRGQLLHHDPVTYNVMEQLWKEIEEWNDPYNNNITNTTIKCCEPRGCWKSPLQRNDETHYPDTIDL